jgi:hypothetical protein
VDPELISYLDAQFASVRTDLGAHIDAVREDLGARIDAVWTDLEAKIVTEVSRLDEKIDTGLARVEARIETEVTRLDAKIDSEASRLDAKIDSSAAETRRHFDVVMERMQAGMALLAEGTQMVDEKGERRYAEIRADLTTLDQRVTRLEAKRLPRRRRPRR